MHVPGGEALTRALRRPVAELYTSAAVLGTRPGADTGDRARTARKTARPGREAPTGHRDPRLWKGLPRMSASTPAAVFRRIFEGGNVVMRGVVINRIESLP